MAEKSLSELIGEKPKGSFIRISKILPLGSLEAREQSSGAIVFYWRYTSNGRGKRELIGQYSPRLPPKTLEPKNGEYSIQAAIKAAEALSKAHNDSLKKDGVGYDEVKRITKKAKIQEREAIQAKESQTLQMLMADYCQYLKINNRRFSEVENCIKNHLLIPHPKIAQLGAAEISPETLADVIRFVKESGKIRTGNKLRAYLRAAYQLASAARFDSDIPLRFKSYGINTNPISVIPPNSKSNKTDKNPLSFSEMQTYWQIIKNAKGYQGALLRIHLLSGGLRPLQLLRLKAKDYDGQTITLFDGKGKRSEKRIYQTPISNTIKPDFEQFKGEDYLFSLDGGITHIRQESLLTWAKNLVGNQIAGFKIKRIRSGIETLLAGRGVSQAIRGQLQSHGISGVQLASYDAHDYLMEKQQALMILERALSEKPKPILELKTNKAA